MTKCILFFYLLLGLCTFVQAEETSKDNTGTNPINFTHDFRMYYNYAELNTNGDGKSHTATLEYRYPISETWSIRARRRGVKNEIDITGNGVDDIYESGFGDMDLRLINVPYVNMKKKFAFAWGLEAFLDTADDSLGTGSTALGPQMFAVFFKPPGGGALMAPAYQHVFSVDGNDMHQGRLDVFYLYQFKDKFITWLMINPQGVIDYDNDNNASWNVDLEAGKMITGNQSLYFRPGSGIGGHRLFDWDLEIGWKMVW